MSRFLIKLITSFFFIGYLPLIPGTFGSIVGLCIFIFLRHNPVILLLVGCLIMITGFYLCGRAAKLFSRRDPPQIVVDEITGMLISFMGVAVDNKLALVIGFVVFRILDSIKPYPANYFQRKVGSIGIMGDDIIAGIYTSFVLHIIFFCRSWGYLLKDFLNR